MVAPDTGEIGQIIDGKFRIVEKLHADRHAVVYRADHVGIQRHVHIKTLLRGLPSDGPDAQRLMREARAAGSVAHKNVQSVVDSGVDADGRPFIVYEALDAPTIEQLAQTNPDPQRAAKLVLQMLDGLRAIHRGGVVHRSLRPSHLRVVPIHGGNEIVKITGFEEAVFLAEADTAEPPDLGDVDNPCIAPELRRGGIGADPRVDFYAAGAIMRLLLLRGETSRVSDLARRAVDRAMSEHPEDRFVDVDSFVHAVLLITTTLPTASRSELPPADPLFSDLVYLHRRRSVLPNPPTRLRPEARVHLLSVLLSIEAIFRLVGEDAWQRIVSAVPDVERVLPGSGETETNLLRGVQTDLLVRVLAAADLVGGRADLGLIAQIGEGISRRGLRRIAPNLPESLTPDGLVDGFAEIWSMFSRQGSVTITQRTPTSAKLSIRGQIAPSVEVCALVAGLTRGALEQADVTEAQVNVTSCQAAGDAACGLALAWQSRWTA